MGRASWVRCTRPRPRSSATRCSCRRPPAGTVLVGSATFTPTTASTGTLSYNVSNIPGRGNVVVSKSIERFAFQTILLGGNYSGVLSSTTSQCANSADNGTVISDIDPQVTQTLGGTLQFIIAFTNATGLELHDHRCGRAGRPALPRSGGELQLQLQQHQHDGLDVRDQGNVPRHRGAVARRQRGRLRARRELLGAAALTSQRAARCRTHSNRHTAAAAAALSDSMPPGIGIVTRCVACASSAARARRLRCRSRAATRPRSRVA